MAERINQAIAALAEDRAIWYVGAHSGHVLTAAQGRADAATWADYINIGMEHGAFDMTGLAAYMAGLVAGGPTASGHRSPAVIVEAPVNGIDADHVRYNAWQFRQILGRGVHGILLCQAETPEATAAFVESCRYPHHAGGVDPDLAAPLARLDGATAGAPRPGMLGRGTRGRGSETTAAPIWGVSAEDYMRLADPWPLNPSGALLLGVKLESPEGIARCEEILDVPGLGFAEMGPGDLGLALGYTTLRREPYPPEMQRARDRVLAACRARGIAFLEGGSAATVIRRIDEGVRVIADHAEESARLGRAHQALRHGRA